ncbi:WD40 repeat domain-containing serine/threonine protein kinase, partial [Phytoactinopolyspora endophytica]|uniref:WD40 repeat domain-containing serine/threonine protein kinase n=1 Tax=Phytoactinopolyspora endophytica TaxID=1642495 RepID=UPI00197C778B
MVALRPLAPGDPSRIGNYQLSEVLGRGGQGSVYLGETPAGRPVAVKILNDQMVTEPAARRRFLRESEIARRVAVFCTAQVLDVGFEANRPYLVSEYIQGPSLQQLVTDEGPRAGSSLDRLAVSTLTALSAIHRAGILHRDLKPSNVIMGREGPVVIDFGIARSLEHATTGSALVGTPAYMAPELIGREPAGPGSDVFSWASTMVFASTGHTAFGGGPVPAILHAVLNAEPDMSGAPDRLRRLLSRALAKRPDDRPTIDELLAELTGHETDTHRVPGPAPARHGQATTAFLPPPQPTASPLSTPPSVPFGQPVGEIFTGHTAAITSLAIDDLEGRSVVVSADADGTLRRWDLFTGQQLGEPMRGHERARGHITSVVVTQSDRRSLIVSGDRSERVRLWDLTSGDCLEEWDQKGNVLAVGQWDGRPVLIGGRGAVVEIFDLPTGRLACRPLTIPFYRHDPGARPVVSQLAATRVDGRTVIVAGCYADHRLNRAVWTFDVATGEALHLPLNRQEGSIDLMATAQHDGQPIVVSYGRTRWMRAWAMRAWSLSTGEAFGKVEQARSVRRTIASLATVRLAGRPTVVHAAHDGTVRVLDVLTGQHIGQPIRDHERPAGHVTSMTATHIAGDPVVVVGR